jgi:hypothetical protein
MELALPQNWDVAFFKNTVGNKGLSFLTACAENVLQVLIAIVLDDCESDDAADKAMRACAHRALKAAECEGKGERRGRGKEGKGQASATPV